MVLPDDSFLFGRVVSTAARWALAEDSGTVNLVYVYDYRSSDKKVPDRQHLGADRLLVPPQLINRLGWSRGYFETLANLPLEEGEVLREHCFQTNVYAAGPRWFDERANALPEPVPPVGAWGAGNWLTLEAEVFRALGLLLDED